MAKDLSEELFHYMFHCMNLMQRNHPHPHKQPDDLGHGQLLVLKILANNKGISQRELLERRGTRPAALSEMLTKLEQKGYIERTLNAQDRRVFDIRLTDKGEKAAAGSDGHSISDFYFSALSVEEQEQLLSLLKKVVESLGLKHDDDVDNEEADLSNHEGSHGFLGNIFSSKPHKS